MGRIISVRLWSIIRAAVLSVGLLWPNISGATVTIFTDRSSWNLAVPGATTIDFEAPAAAPFLFVPSPPGFSASGVSFSLVAGSTGNLFLLNPSFYGTPSQVLSSQQSNTGLDGFSIVLPGAVRAIALDLNTIRCLGASCLPGETVTLTLSSGDTFTRTSISAPPIGFVGLTSTTAFTSLTITINGTPGVTNGVLNIDNFSFSISPDDEFLREFDQLVRVFQPLVPPIDDGQLASHLDALDQIFAMGQEFPSAPANTQVEVTWQDVFDLLSKLGCLRLRLDACLEQVETLISQIAEFVIPECDRGFILKDVSCIIQATRRTFQINPEFDLFNFNLSVQIPIAEFFIEGDRFPLNIPFLGTGSSFSIVEIKRVVPELGTVEFSVQGVRLVSEAFANLHISKAEVGKEQFEVKGDFTLGDRSNGINPFIEHVTLHVGRFFATIPAGSFKLDKKGRYKFEGIISSVLLEVVIQDSGVGGFDFKAEGTNANMTAIINPVEVTLTIGDDSGTATVNSEFK